VIAKSRNLIFNHDIFLRKVHECPHPLSLGGNFGEHRFSCKITDLVVIENNKIWRHNQKGIFATAKINNRARRKKIRSSYLLPYSILQMLSANTLFFWYSFKIISVVLAK
jgi:hypothetical protein